MPISYIKCHRNCVHWGQYGAAGALLCYRGEDGKYRYLLTLRSGHTHTGDCWGIPGGAREPNESSLACALRETFEEICVLVDRTYGAEKIDTCDHGNWRYLTYLIYLPEVVEIGPLGDEIDAAGWFTKDEVDQLKLHPEFQLTWNKLHEVQVRN